MANLIVEIGNTAVKAAWSEGTVLGKTFRYQGERIRSFILSLMEREKPVVLVISSVFEIPAADEKLYSEKCERIVILDTVRKSILSDHDIPEYVSCDRAASIIAARSMFKGKGCTLVDFGTTLSIDFIDPEGRYCGGNISLGYRTRFKALNRYSRSLPLIDPPSETDVTGNSFETSVASGVVSGIMFEIDGYIGFNPDNIVVFTGGDANYFAKRMKNPIFVVCNLVLKGLALIADNYVR